MALTDLYPINTTVKKSVEYITKEEKISSKLDFEKKYIYEYMCNKDDAENEFKFTKEILGSKAKKEGYFLYQSFKRGEVSEETCFEIGKKLAKRFLGDEYQFILVTHTDKKHLHNHIVFNSVSFKTGKAFSNKFKEKYILREISNDLCREYNLSILEYPTFNKGKNQRSKKSRNEDIIEEQITVLKNISKSFEEFTNNLNEENIEIKEESGKLYFKLKNMKNFYKKINGLEYKKESIKEYINSKFSRRNILDEEKYLEEIKRVDIENLINKIIYHSNTYDEFKTKLNDVNIYLDDTKLNNLRFYYLNNNNEITFNNKTFDKDSLVKIIDDKIKLFSKNNYFEKESITKNILDLIYKNISISLNFSDFRSRMLKDGIEINEDRKYLRFFLTGSSKKFLRARVDGEYFYKEKIELQIEKINTDPEYKQEFINQYINIEKNSLNKKYEDLKNEYKNLFNEAQAIKNRIDYKNIFKDLKANIGFMLDLKNEKFSKNYGLKYWGTINNTNIAMNSYNQLYLKYGIKTKSKISEKIIDTDFELKNLYNVNKKIQKLNKEIYKEIVKLNKSRGNISFERKINLQAEINANQKQINFNNEKINSLKYEKNELMVIRENIYKFYNIDYNKEKEIEINKTQEIKIEEERKKEEHNKK